MKTEQHITEPAIAGKQLLGIGVCRPISFSTKMVKAILAGQKKQTRRIIKNVSADDIFYGLEENPELIPKDQIDTDGKIYNGLWAHFEERSVRCPYGKVGDPLWVRETFGYDIETGKTVYEAGTYFDERDNIWSNSGLFMEKRLPSWFCRKSFAVYG